MLDSVVNKQVTAAEALAPAIKPRAGEIEAARQLPQDIAQSFLDADLVRMGIAKDYGGLESAPLDIIRTIVPIARADASAAWCLMNYQTAALISGFVSPDCGKEVFSNAETCIPSGVLAPVGRGQRVEGGIKVSGRWSFGSGCPNANWFFGMTVIQGDNDPADNTQVVMAMFSEDQFKTIDNWNVSGLSGSGSGDVVVEQAFVPEGRWWSLQEAPTLDGALFKIPLSTIFPPCVAAVSLGIAEAALDEFEQMLNAAESGHASPMLEHPGIHADFARAEALVGSATSFIFSTVEAMWDSVCRGDSLSQEQRRAVRLAGTHAAASCAQAIDLLFDAAGSSSILLEQPLQRYWRDAHAVTKHIQVSRKNFETMGCLRLTGNLNGQL